MTIKTVEIRGGVGATGLGNGEENLTHGGGSRKKRKHLLQNAGGNNNGGVKVWKGGVSGYQSPTHPMSHGANLKTAFEPVLPNLPTVATVAGASIGIPDGTVVGGGHAQHNNKDKDSKNIKVELKGKKQGGGVHLQPKKAVSSCSQQQSNQIGGKTHKNRKIKIKLASLSRKHKKTHSIVKKIKEMNIDELRTELVKKGLIKENSKAPESVLRQIAADAQIIKEKSL